MEKKRNIQWVYLAKGIAIILVVLGHVLRGLNDTGFYEKYNDIFSYIDFIIYSFHMPLFFIISGFLYSRGKRVSNIKEYGYFVKRKAYSIMVPYFIFSWIQIGIKLIMSKSVNSQVNYKMIYNIIYEPIEQFWFLYCLMIIFLIIGFIDLCIKNEKIKFLIVLMLFTIGNLQYLKHSILLTSLSNLIYFYLGTNLYKFKLDKIVYRKPVLLIGTLLTYCIVIILLYNNIFKSKIITTVVLAITGSILVISLCMLKENKKSMLVEKIIRIGVYSMPIYLLHITFTAGTRIILVKLGIINLTIQIILQLVLGIICPIVLNYIYNNMEYYLNKNKVINKKEITT